jgi:hypothetical protein
MPGTIEFELKGAREFERLLKGASLLKPTYVRFPAASAASPQQQTGRPGGLEGST